MRVQWAVSIVFGIALMLMISVLPAMAFLTGNVVFVNPAENHGMIEHVAGDVTTLYQFRIPQDLSDPSYNPSVGDRVDFDVEPENSRLATNVKLSCASPGSGCGI